MLRARAWAWAWNFSLYLAFVWIQAALSTAFHCTIIKAFFLGIKVRSRLPFTFCIRFIHTLRSTFYLSAHWATFTHERFTMVRWGTATGPQCSQVRPEATLLLIAVLSVISFRTFRLRSWPLFILDSYSLLFRLCPGHFLLLSLSNVCLSLFSLRLFNNDLFSFGRCNHIWHSDFDLSFRCIWSFHHSRLLQLG